MNTSAFGAKVFLDGEMVGTTPYTHKDTKIVGSTTTLKLEKEVLSHLRDIFHEMNKLM